MEVPKKVSRSNLKNKIREFLGEEFFCNNINEIRSAVKDCSSFLDLGCGNNSPYIKYIHKEEHRATGVDLYANVSGAYREIVRRDVLEYLREVPEKTFDAVLAFDVVEHFEEQVALQLVHEMERVASKTVVIVTPNGFWPGMIDGPGMTHLCGFTAEDFKERGYAVLGGGGLALVRSRKHSYMKGLRFASLLPIQMIFFNIGQIVAKRYPKWAYGICAIKKNLEE